jgi:hypothetical protein
MTTTTPTPADETWLEITTRTGLQIHAPKPDSSHVSLQTLLEEALSFTSTSRLTNQTYHISLRDVAVIREYQRTYDPDRLLQAQMKAASQGSSRVLSMPSREPESSSAGLERPSAISPGGPGNETIH